jgi:D-cysteine desulfhydrase
VAADLEQNALYRALPMVRDHCPWTSLGQFPTPVQSFPSLPGDVYIKREDLSSPIYGGNKVRTLEGHFGRALRDESPSIWATGAFGSNHATATVLHAKAQGLPSGVILFRQPHTQTAQSNLVAMLADASYTEDVGNVLALPLSVHRIRRRHPRAYVMPPGGATPLGCLGHVSAAIELAEQIRAGDCPNPQTLVVAVGSCCTTAGLLVGIAAARQLGIGFTQPPIVVAVRVTPWPVTDRRAILLLAYRTAKMLERISHGKVSIGYRELNQLLEVNPHFFGGGYGKPTAATLGAIALMSEAGGPPLDEVYSGKSGACLLQLAMSGSGPLLFWATKSSAPLPASAPDLDAPPRRWVRWMRSELY